jgi:hypothetical protein
MVLSTKAVIVTVHKILIICFSSILNEIQARTVLFRGQRVLNLTDMLLSPEYFYLRTVNCLPNLLII